MLSDWAKGILKANHIEEEDVIDVSGSMEVTFKDGTVKQICENWTRVMGYLRPSSEFNKGKYSEFKTRKSFSEEKTVAHFDDFPDDAA